MRPALPALAILLSLAQVSAAQQITGLVDRVIDGDTFAFPGVSIRLCGIDAPERGAQGATASAQALRDLISNGTVRCIPVGEGTVCDGRSKKINRNRVVAQCFSGKLDLAAEQVKRGHACDWRRFSGGAYTYPGQCVK